MSGMWLFPVIDAIILGGALFLYAPHLLNHLIRSSHIKEKLRAKIAAIDLEGYADAMIERRMDGFFQGLRESMPMSSLLLTGSLINKLKSTGKAEMMKMAPEAKEALLEKYDAEAENFIAQINLPGVRRTLGLYGAIAGLFLGVAHAVLFLLWR